MGNFERDAKDRLARLRLEILGINQEIANLEQNRAELRKRVGGLESFLGGDAVADEQPRELLLDEVGLGRAPVRVAVVAALLDKTDLRGQELADSLKKASSHWSSPPSSTMVANAIRQANRTHANQNGEGVDLIEQAGKGEPYRLVASEKEQAKKDVKSFLKRRRENASPR